MWLKANYCGITKIWIHFVSNWLDGKLILVRVPNMNDAIDWNNNDTVHINDIFGIGRYIHKHQFSAITILSQFQRSYKSSCFTQCRPFYRTQVDSWSEDMRSLKNHCLGIILGWVPDRIRIRFYWSESGLRKIVLISLYQKHNYQARVE